MQNREVAQQARGLLGQAAGRSAFGGRRQRSRDDIRASLGKHARHSGGVPFRTRRQ